MNIFSQDYWNLHKPQAATHKEWSDWRTLCKQQQPWAFWLKETVPDWIEDIWRAGCRPLKNITWWIRYRTTNRYHVVSSGLEPGYHDKPELMIHTNFQLLVDFVEIECANMATIFLPEWYNQLKPRWKRMLRIAVRNPKAGVAYLLKPLEEEGCEQQTITRKEIVELYHWWTSVRPGRVDPYQASGWDHFCKTNQDIFDLDSQAQDSSMNIIHDIHALEQQFLEEDQAMLMRLVAVRMNLWT
jgi:hypothetical protein